MTSARRELSELTKRVEAALHALDTEIAKAEHLLEHGNLRGRAQELARAHLAVLVGITDALRTQLKAPKASLIRQYGRIAVLTLAMSILNAGGERATNAAIEKVERMISKAEELESAESSAQLSDEEVSEAADRVRSAYRPASRDDIPWDSEDERWVADVVDVGDAVDDVLGAESELLRRAVAEQLASDGSEWVSEEYLRGFTD